MPIHIRHHDKNDAKTQQLEISLVIPEEKSCSQMSYTAIKAMFGVLYGSI
jgi:nanoRNase/pAp phosphatase (c-di-AMP/oligoRNAs hydrolase)